MTAVPRWQAVTALAAGATLLATTACSTPEAGNGADADAEGPFTIGVSNGFIGSEWREQMLATLEDTFAEYEEEGVVDELVVESADVDVNGQIQQVRNLINSEVDAIIVNPNSPEALNEVFAEATEQGIEVVAIDQAVTAEEVTNVVIDQEEWGSLTAEWLADEVGDDAEIVAVNGIDGHPANEDRWAGAEQVFDDAGIDVAAIDYAEWDQATGQQVTQNLLASHSDVDGIFVQDGMAQGAFQALESEGEVGDIALTGEARVGFLRNWGEQRDEDEDFSSVGVPNPPAGSVSALHVTVRMLEGQEFTEDALDGNSLYLPIPETVTDENFDEQFDEVTDEPDTHSVDGHLSQEEADEYFE